MPKTMHSHAPAAAGTQPSRPAPQEGTRAVVDVQPLPLHDCHQISSSQLREVGWCWQILSVDRHDSEVRHPDQEPANTKLPGYTGAGGLTGGKQVGPLCALQVFIAGQDLCITCSITLAVPMAMRRALLLLGRCPSQPQDVSGTQSKHPLRLHGWLFAGQEHPGSAPIWRLGRRHYGGHSRRWCSCRLGSPTPQRP